MLYFWLYDEEDDDRLLLFKIQGIIDGEGNYHVVTNRAEIPKIVDILEPYSDRRIVVTGR